MGLKTNAKLYANGTLDKSRCRGSGAFQVTAFTQRLRQGAAINELKFAAHRHAAGDSRHADAVRLEHGGDVMCSRLTFVGEVGSQDDFTNNAVSRPGQQAVKRKLSRPDTIQRRNLAHQDVIQALVSERLLHHVHIDRCFDDTKQACIASGRGTALADFELGEGIAALTMADRLQGVADCLAKAGGPRTIMLHQVIGQTLSRFRPDPRKAAQGLDQPLKAARIHLRTAA